MKSMGDIGISIIEHAVMRGRPPMQTVRAFEDSVELEISS